MMDTSSRSKETCHGCSKFLLKHHPFVICKTCEKICHAKCGSKLFKFDHIEDSWLCSECNLLEESRYNPFKSYRHDKYSQPDNDAFEEIHELESLLNDCNRHNFKELKSLITSSNDPFSILFKNIDGVASNFDTFSTELLINNLSIITMAETNIDECNKTSYNLQGYQSEYQSKIADKFKGSGLAIYIKDTFIYNKMDEFSHCTPNLESLFISIIKTINPILVGVVYRPPNGDDKLFLSELNSLFQKLPSSNVYLTGDFNLDMLTPTISDYKDTIYGHGFAPLISIATHFKPGCKPSCIDNILTNSTDNIIKSGVCESAASHHLPIFCLIQSSCKISEDEPNLHRYDYNESNMSKFEEIFKTYFHESNYFHESEFNEKNFESFIKDINDKIDECFLMDESIYNSKRNRINNPWITSGIIASINHRDYLYKLWRKSVKRLKTKDGDPSLYNNYKLYRKKLNTIIKCAKNHIILSNLKKLKGIAGKHGN